MLNLIALEEMAGRSDRNLLRFVDTIISQGADTRAQDDILDSLKSIKDSSMVTTQALLAALDPITAFQVQLQTLGGGVFENISQGITKLVDENELTASQAGNLGKLVAELLDPANSQVVAMLDVQSQINEMLTQGVTATRQQELLKQIIQKASATSEDLLGRAADAPELKQVILGSFSDLVGEVGLLSLSLDRSFKNNTDKQDELFKQEMDLLSLSLDRSFKNNTDKQDELFKQEMDLTQTFRDSIPQIAKNVEKIAQSWMIEHIDESWLVTGVQTALEVPIKAMLGTMTGLGAASETVKDIWDSIFSRSTEPAWEDTPEGGS